MRNRFGQKGVTLVEILLSLAILTIVTSAISSGTNYLTRRLVRAKNASIARNLSWKRLAEVKASKIEPSERLGIFGSDFPGFRYSEKIEKAIVKGQSINGLYAYNLTVMWQEAWKEDKVEFSTYIADYNQTVQQIPSEQEAEDE